jgi:hypothetical protein
MLLSFCGFSSCENRDRELQPPLFEDCIILSDSITCIDKRLNNTFIDGIINTIQSNDSMSQELQTELINYFNFNRSAIIKNKQFNIGFRYIGYFRGYFTTNPNDRGLLETFMNKNLNQLEKFINRCGKYTEQRMICN